MCDFIDENGKRPSCSAKNKEEKKLANWIQHQTSNYNLKGAEFSKKGMKNFEIWEFWKDIISHDKYNKFLVLEPIQDWKNKHKEMCDFIDTNGKRPSYKSKEITEKKLETWIGTQKHNYELLGPINSKKIMKIKEIWDIWNETITNPIYKEYLCIDLVENWKIMHKKMCNFIDDNNKTPSHISKILNEKKLARWIGSQKKNYESSGPLNSKFSMKNQELWDIWNTTINNPKYKEYLCDLNDYWKLMYKKLLDFIDKNKKNPIRISINEEEKKIGTWLGVQKSNYESSGPINSKCSMKNQKIWDIWNETINNPIYKEYLCIDLVENWKFMHKKMCDFIDKNNKTPSQYSVNIEEKKLANWFNTQKINYNSSEPKNSKQSMKIQEIWDIWNETINNPIYKEYICVDSVENWKIIHKKMCDFIDKNSKRPSDHTKDPDEKILARWIGSQKAKYNPKGSESSKFIMKNAQIFQIWKDTIEDEKYSKFLVIDLFQNWKNQHKKMCEFIDEKRKHPSSSSKDPIEKTLASWISTQKKNYNQKGTEFSKERMKTHEIYQIWKDTLSDPKYKDFLNKSIDDKSSKIDSQKDSIASEDPSEVSESEEPESPPSPPKKKIVMKTHKYTPSSQSESTAPKKAIIDSDYKLISRAWSIQNSKTTHQKLLEDPTEWYNYHDARDISFQGYVDQSQIPRNRVISYLEKKRKHRIPKILDLGCGRNNIEHHFTHINPNPKFTIIGYDHVAEQGVNSRVGNISDLSQQEPDETADICIYSQSLMGSDKIDYLDEGYRILRYNGEFVIADHIDIFDDVKEKLVGLGCNIIKEENDSNESKWFLLIAQKV
jgi:ribosomal RNA-processing protein 8